MRLISNECDPVLYILTTGLNLDFKHIALLLMQTEKPNQLHSLQCLWAKTNQTLESTTASDPMTKNTVSLGSYEESTVT